MDTQYNALQKQIETTSDALRNQQEANFKAMMAAIAESRAKNDLDTFKLIAALAERVAALEAART